MAGFTGVNRGSPTAKRSAHETRHHRVDEHFADNARLLGAYSRECIWRARLPSTSFWRANSGRELRPHAPDLAVKSADVYHF